MSKTVVGLFSNYQEADSVVRDLQRAGFVARDISIVANQQPPKDGSDTEEVESLGSGVGAGAALGGIAGLILGLGALAIPGIGPIIAAGPIAAALTGAGIGAAAGGLLGTLSQMGVPEDEANFYAEGIRRGGALVAVHANDQQVQTAVDVLNRHHAVDVDERDGELSAEEESQLAGAPVQPVAGPTETVGADAALKPGRVYQAAGAESEWEQDYRNHHATTFYQQRGAYGDYLPAYRVGEQLGSEGRYSRSDFLQMEPEIRAEYERNSPLHPWEDVRDAARYSFEKARQRRG